MTEERWTEQTERLLATAMLEELDRQEANDDELSVGWYVARAGLAALADAGLLVAPGWHLDPEGSAQLITYSDGWQYAVAVTPNTEEPLVYGDQYWVSSGRVLADAHPHGRIVRRKVAAYVGPWREVSP